MWHGVYFRSRLTLSLRRVNPAPTIGKEGNPIRLCNPSPVLAEGTKIPNVTVSDDAGKPVNTADLTGKTLVLWFYPKDDTPG